MAFKGAVDTVVAHAVPVADVEDPEGPLVGDQGVVDLATLLNSNGSWLKDVCVVYIRSVSRDTLDNAPIGC